MIARPRLLLVAALMLVSAALSTLLLLQHHGESIGSAAVAQVCGEGADSGCDTVNRSSWSTVAGIPLAAAGIVFASGVGMLALLGALSGLSETQRGVAAMVFVALVAALVVDVGLLGVQAFVVKAFCKLCLGTYVLNALSLAAVWPLRRDAPAAGATLRTTEGRLIAAGVLGAMVIAVSGVATAEAVLGSRETARGEGLFKSTTPVPADLAQAQAEVRRLQETLDDPAKLDHYFTQKADREFQAAKPQVFATERTPVKGPGDAPVKIVEFSDFLCPFCRNLALGLKGWLPQTQGRVSIAFKNYPLDKSCNDKMQRTVHEGACNLAFGAVCAQEQGKFWEYHDRVFQQPRPNPQLGDVATIAQEAGLDRGTMERCLASTRPLEQVKKELAEGHAAEVNSTPSVFVQGRKLPRIQDLPQAVDTESAKLGLPPLQPAPPAAQH